MTLNGVIGPYSALFNRIRGQKNNYEAYLGVKIYF